MAIAWRLFTYLTCTAVTCVFPCDAGSLPPPTNLSHKWLDPFTVNVSWSWKQPSNLPDNCKIEFETQHKKRIKGKNFTDRCLTEEMDSDTWNYTIRTISNCDDWDDSQFVITTVRTPKPRAELVKDFKCFLDPNGMNCSWIPVNRSVNLTLSYRKCGKSENVRKKLKKCDQYYRSGVRDSCYLQVGADISDTCINTHTEAALSTFKPLLVVPSPKLTIKQKESYLYLVWTPPKVGENCEWNYEVCLTRCNENEVCKNITEGERHEPYNENCIYKVRSRVNTLKYCPPVSSDFSDVVTYGANKPPDETLTVVAIVIPIILSVCVILSCYCFRRHSAIICPIIPDPSAIFKEMMMNGNRDLKPTGGSLYTPVPETTEQCKITLVKENCVLQQNS